ARRGPCEDRDRTLTVPPQNEGEVRLLPDRDDLVEGDEVTAPALHLKRTDVFGAYSFARAEPHSHVIASAVLARARDARTSEEGVQGRADLAHVDVEVGSAVAPGADADLGRPDRVVGVDVDEKAARGH